MSMQTNAAERRLAIAHHGRRLQYLTIAWNSAECLISIGAGLIAGSIALVGFGLDSAIEVASSLAAVWRLARDQDEAERERAERRALRIIGVCFVALALYVGVDATKALVSRETPAASSVGIVVAALSLVVMPILVRLKRRVAAQLNSGALEAERGRRGSVPCFRGSCLVGLGSMGGSGCGGPVRLAGLPWVPFCAR